MRKPNQRFLFISLLAVTLGLSLLLDTFLTYFDVLFGTVATNSLAPQTTNVNIVLKDFSYFSRENFNQISEEFVHLRTGQLEEDNANNNDYDDDNDQTTGDVTVSWKAPNDIVRFRMIQNAMILNSNAKNLPLVSLEDCKRLCLTAGVQKCTHFSRFLYQFSDDLSKRNLSPKQQESLRNQILQERREYFSRTKSSAFSIESVANFTAEELSRISPRLKYCQFHRGLQDIQPVVESFDGPKVFHAGHEVWLPEYLKEKIMIDNSNNNNNNNNAQRNVNNKRRKEFSASSSASSSLVAIGVQVVQSSGIESVIGQLATWLKNEPNVVVFLDRNDDQHLEIVAEAVLVAPNNKEFFSGEEEEEDDHDHQEGGQQKHRRNKPEQYKNENFNSCVRVQELVSIFSALTNKRDAETGLYDSASPLNDLKVEILNINNFPAENLKSHFSRKFRTNISSSRELKFGSNSVARVQHPVVGKSWFGQPYLPENNNNHQKNQNQFSIVMSDSQLQACFRQKLTTTTTTITTTTTTQNNKTSHVVIDLSFPLPNIIFDPTTNNNNPGFQMFRFLNPQFSQNEFLKRGLPNPEEEMSNNSNNNKNKKVMHYSISIRALHELSLFFPNASWYFLIEDQTFAVIHSLRYFLLLASLSKQHIRNQRHFFGFKQTVNPLKAHSHDFISTRSGALIPRGVIMKIRRKIQEFSRDSKDDTSFNPFAFCLAACRQLYIDERLSCCLHSFDVSEIHLSSFFPLRLEHAYPSNVAKNFSIPVSFDGVKLFEDFLKQEKQIEKAIEKKMSLLLSYGNVQQDEREEELGDALAAVRGEEVKTETTETKIVRNQEEEDIRISPIRKEFFFKRVRDLVLNKRRRRSIEDNEEENVVLFDELLRGNEEVFNAIDGVVRELV